MQPAIPFFRINDDCTCCGACEVSAPRHFGPTERGIYQCFQQPRDAQELERCLEAAHCCPVDTIEVLPQDPTGR